MFSFTFLCKFSWVCNFAIFVWSFIKFSPKCGTKKLGVICTILGSFCSFLNWEGAIILPQIELRKIPEISIIDFLQERLIESHGLQCGFCTPGFVMSMFCLLRNNPTPTRDDVERALEGKQICLSLYSVVSVHQGLLCLCSVCSETAQHQPEMM